VLELCAKATDGGRSSDVRRRIITDK
jgi:hypothetical protein